MNTFKTLVLREWMQHRFGWALLTLVPLAIALFGLAVGQIELDFDTAERAGPQFPTLLAMIALGAGTVVTFVILGATSLILLSGLARRDHGDRSVEFWLSLPTSHTASLGAPLATHLLLVPAAALALGLVSGWLVSIVLVTRLAGFPAWLALPWVELASAGVAFVLRGVAGLPLAVMWAAPLLLAVVLANAYLKRWGLPVLLLALAMGGVLLDRWLGDGAVAYTIGATVRQAGQALIGAGQQTLQMNEQQLPAAALRQVPAWLLGDFVAAIKALASPLFAGCVLSSAALFALLLDWRSRGASASH
jgi:ABC-2 type transport system permease protein